MKKFTLLLSSIFCYGIMNAQTVLFDNGPLVNSPGAGAGGADVSNTHDGLSTYGAGHAVSSGYKVADDFTVTGNGWTVDSIVFFAYQTNSGNTSSLTGVRMGIWDASPAAGGNVIYGDTGVGALSFTTYWSGIYRTTEAALTDVARPIMRNVIGTPGLTLSAGTYFASWQTDGSASFSGPWAPPVTLGAGVIITGDALQYSPVNLSWATLTDLGTATEQGLPFIVYGQVITGIAEIKGNNDFGISNLYPVPVKDKVSFTLSSKQNTDVTITLRDAQGKEILTQQLKATAGANIVSLDLSKQSSGVYFITANSKIATVVSKFVKEN